MQNSKSTGPFAFRNLGYDDHRSLFTVRATDDINSGQPEHHLLNRFVDNRWQLNALPEQFCAYLHIALFVPV